VVSCFPPFGNSQPPTNLPTYLPTHLPTYQPTLCVTLSTATNRARLRSADELYVYEAVADKATRTLTIYFAPNSEADPTINPATAKCSATFTLAAGYAFDMEPVPGAKCPTGSAPVVTGSGTLCKVCETGSAFKNGKCRVCPAAQYTDRDGATKCLPCPAGTINGYEGAFKCAACPPGSVPTPDKKACAPCKANTYAPAGTARCKACPAGTFSVSGAGRCAYPFPN
jgi:hypothetical protein